MIYPGKILDFVPGSNTGICPTYRPLVPDRIPMQDLPAFLITILHPGDLSPTGSNESFFFQAPGYNRSGEAGCRNLLHPSPNT
jgi:hypothetical protein